MKSCYLWFFLNSRTTFTWYEHKRARRSWWKRFKSVICRYWQIWCTEKMWTKIENTSHKYMCFNLKRHYVQFLNWGGSISRISFPMRHIIYGLIKCPTIKMKLRTMWILLLRWKEGYFWSWCSLSEKLAKIGDFGRSGFESSIEEKISFHEIWLVFGKISS